MKVYHIPMLATLPTDWSDIPKAPMNETPWLKEYIPETYAQIVFVKEDGFWCKMTCRESNPLAVYKNWMDPVCEDSCMEFFAAYDNTSPKYLNVEANSRGTVLAQLGTDRYDRVPIDTIIGRPIVVKTEVSPEEWTLTIHTTLAELKTIFGLEASVFIPGYTFRANLYKCGDNTAVEHYNMWNPVGTPEPDYHQFDYFGCMILSAE